MSVRRLAAVVAGSAIAVSAPAVALAHPAAHTTAHAAARATVVRAVPVGGVTMLKISPNTGAVLTKNGVKVQAVSEARVTASGITFPIKGGLVVAKTLAGRINHVGGLAFLAGGKRLVIRDFTINTVTKRLTAYVEQARVRIPVLQLQFGKAKVTATTNHVTVGNVRALLTATAAKALDGYFGTTLFTGGLPIGVARVSAQVVVAATAR